MADDPRTIFSVLGTPTRPFVMPALKARGPTSMRGHDQIITMLSDVLTAHFVHARMCENSGYERRWNKVRKESIGEMRHADKLIARILYLEGILSLRRLGKVNVGHHLRAAQKSPQALRVQSQVFEGEPRAAEPHRLRRWPGWLERNARRAQGGPHN